MKKLNYVALSLLLGINSYSVFAATNVLNTSTNSIEQRTNILKSSPRFKQGFDIGYSAAANEKLEMYEWVDSGLYLANELSNITNSTVSLIPENNSRILERLIKAKKYKYLYVTPDLAVLAEEMAYTPIIKTSKDSESVNVVLANATTTDLANKKIGIVNNSVEGKIALFNLKAKSVKSETANTTAVLKQLLDTKKVDAIVLNKEDAQQLINKNMDSSNKSLYKINSTNGAILGNILLAHSSLPDDEVDALKNAFLTIKLDQNHKNLSNFFPNASEGSIFEEFNKDILKNMRTILAYTNEDYGRVIYTPDSNRYTESNALYLKSQTKTVSK